MSKTEPVQSVETEQMSSVEAHEDLTPWFQPVSAVTGPLSWRDWFGNDYPVELDIGCHKGQFLVNAAECNPQVNFLGFELDFSKAAYAGRRLRKRNQPNARVMGGDCRDALTELIQPHTVAAVHVYFPDPWWKRRHKRRRLFTNTFLELVHRVLVPGGLLHSWTDVEQYYQVISSLVDHHPGFQKLTPPAENTPEHDMDYRTSFERKKRQAGCTIHRGLWQARETDSHPEP